MQLAGAKLFVTPHANKCLSQTMIPSTRTTPFATTHRRRPTQTTRRLCLRRRSARTRSRRPKASSSNEQYAQWNSRAFRVCAVFVFFLTRSPQRAASQMSVTAFSHTPSRRADAPVSLREQLQRALNENATLRFELAARDARIAFLQVRYVNERTNERRACAFVVVDPACLCPVHAHKNSINATPSFESASTFRVSFKTL